jgi:hypothetical protein
MTNSRPAKFSKPSGCDFPNQPFEDDFNYITSVVTSRNRADRKAFNLLSRFKTLQLLAWLQSLKIELRHCTVQSK